MPRLSNRLSSVLAKSSRQGPPEAIGRSEVFLDFQAKLARVAKVERPVLILGERGTGKELAAARLHYLSLRWAGPMVALNCAALAPGLLESELFGHEEGAFTGAVRQRQGRFEKAQDGTLFLDEMGLLPMEVQEKILRVVEYRTFERVGGSEPIQVDVRMIGATSADLPRMTAEGRFKPDLLDRFSFEVLFIPPLRQRIGDIPLLARHFAARMALELQFPEVPQFTEEAMEALEKHSWPGNVRELKNTVERAVYRCEGGVIKEIPFDPFLAPPGSGSGWKAQGSRVEAGTEQPFQAPVGKLLEQSWGWRPGEPLDEAQERIEFAAIKTALERHGYRQKEAARWLGLPYANFRNKLRKHQERLQAEAGYRPRKRGEGAK